MTCDKLSQNICMTCDKLSTPKPRKPVKSTLADDEIFLNIYFKYIFNCTQHPRLMRGAVCDIWGTDTKTPT